MKKGKICLKYGYCPGSFGRGLRELRKEVIPSFPGAEVSEPPRRYVTTSMTLLAYRFVIAHPLAITIGTDSSMSHKAPGTSLKKILTNLRKNQIMIRTSDNSANRVARSRKSINLLTSLSSLLLIVITSSPYTCELQDCRGTNRRDEPILDDDLLVKLRDKGVCRL